MDVLWGCPFSSRAQVDTLPPQLPVWFSELQLELRGSLVPGLGSSCPG